MNSEKKNNFALMRTPLSAIGKAAPESKHISSKMVNETLALTKKTAEPEIWFQTGQKYQRGIGIAQNYAEAAKWFRLAAERGHANAQVYLGVCFKWGLGLQRDHAEAIFWFRKAAQQGDANGQFNLGWMHQHLPTGKDEVQAFKWYLKAAEQGHAYAQFYVGLCYSVGSGVSQNKNQAAKWERKALENGYPNTEFVKRQDW